MKIKNELELRENTTQKVELLLKATSKNFKRLANKIMKIIIDFDKKKELLLDGECVMCGFKAMDWYRAKNYVHDHKISDEQSECYFVNEIDGYTCKQCAIQWKFFSIIEYSKNTNTDTIMLLLQYFQDCKDYIFKKKKEINNVRN